MTEQIESWNGKNFLKIKSAPLREVKISEGDSEDTDQDSPDSLRKEIEPWLTALFQSEHLSLLMGTGITNAVHRLAAITPEEEFGKAPQGMGKIVFSEFMEQMETSASESAKKTGRGTPNIEDQIRVANDLIRGLEIYLSSQVGNEELKKKLDKFKNDLNSGISGFAKDVLTTERNIALSDRLENTM